MNKIKINTLLNSLYNKMNKTEKKKFEKDLVLLSKELLTIRRGKEDIMEFCDDLATQITEDIHGNCTYEISMSSDGMSLPMTEESLKSYHSIYDVIEEYIDKNYNINFVRI